MADHIAVAPADQRSFKPLVHQPGKGVLKSLGVSGARGEHFFKLEIDGNVLHEGNIKNGDCFASAHKIQKENNALALNIEFENELTVEIRDGHVRYTTPRFWAAYETDDSVINVDDQDPDLVSERGFVYKNRRVRLEDSIKTARILEGRQFTAEILSGKDVYQVGEKIEPRVVFNDFRGDPATPANIPNLENGNLEVRYLGRMHVLDEIPLRNVGEDLILDGELRFDRPGDYEISTDFEQHGNEPKEITVLPEIP